MGSGLSFGVKLMITGAILFILGARNKNEEPGPQAIAGLLMLAGLALAIWGLWS